MPPKVKWDFRPKTETETESQSCLGRHGYGSQQVAHSVRCPTIPCILYLSPLPALCQPCGVSLKTRPQGPTVPDADADNSAASSVMVSTQWGQWLSLAHSGLRNSVTYFRQSPNLPTAARRNRKYTECCMTAFGRNRMSAESAHLSTFGAETETEAEIRSTSRWHTVTDESHIFVRYVYAKVKQPLMNFRLFQSCFCDLAYMI